MSRLKRSRAYHDFNQINEPEKSQEEINDETSFFIFSNRIPSPHAQSIASPIIELNEKLEYCCEEIVNDEKLTISKPIVEETESNCYTDSSASEFDFSF